MLIVLDNARDAAAGPAAAARPARPAWCWSPAAASWPAWPPPRAPGCSAWTSSPAHEARSCWPRRLGAPAARRRAGGGRRDRRAVRAAAAGAGGRRRPRRRPARFPLAALAARAPGRAGRLDALDAGDPAASVRAVFSWSYQQLSPTAARMFRLLGLHPGPDISAAAAASLAGVSAAEARRPLGELARAHLIAEHVPGRFAFHDLLRAYAAEQAADRRRAQRRGRPPPAGFSTTTCTPPTRPRCCSTRPRTVTSARRRPGVTAEQLTADHGRRWPGSRPSTRCCSRHQPAAERGVRRPRLAAPLGAGTFLNRRGHWTDQVATQVAAVAAAAAPGDPAGQAVSLPRLAGAGIRLGSFRRRAGLGRPRSLSTGSSATGSARPGHTSLSLGRRARAATARRSATLSRRCACTGPRRPGWRGRYLNKLGWSTPCSATTSRPGCAASRPAPVATSVTARRGSAWDSLGYADHHLGHHTEAIACYQRALTLFGEFGDRYFEAGVLSHLGDARAPPAGSGGPPSLAAGPGHPGRPAASRGHVAPRPAQPGSGARRADRRELSQAAGQPAGARVSAVSAAHTRRRVGVAGRGWAMNRGQVSWAIACGGPATSRGLLTTPPVRRP